MGFTAFDAVVVSEGKTRVTMLRMAVGALELDEAAIRSAITVFDRVLPHPEDVRWSFVYAALDGDRARNLAESETARRRLAALDPRLRVGWLEVGATLKRSARALLVSPIVYHYLMGSFDVENDLNRTRSRRDSAGGKRQGTSGQQSDASMNHQVPKCGRTLSPRGRGGRRQGPRAASPRLGHARRGLIRVPSSEPRSLLLYSCHWQCMWVRRELGEMCVVFIRTQRKPYISA
ncbi:hypothetical protein LXA43DRAFT_1034765 [Ganoderma leucocontextum]|nr:hypothetical protein LXA43DRAFT_1034765 [Ganoderma leucocontextum]